MTRKKIVALLLFSVLLIGSIFVISRVPYFGTIFQRMNNMFMTLDEGSSVEEGSTETRKEFIEEGFNTFLNYPITGIGLNNSGIITNVLVGRETYLHCNYVEILACLGVVGFVLFYAIYFIIIVRAVQLNRGRTQKDYLPIVMAVTLLVIEIGCVTYYEIKTAMYLVLMVVLVNKQNWAVDDDSQMQNELRTLVDCNYKNELTGGKGEK